MLQKDGAISGDVQNNDTIDVLNEQHKWMEVTGFHVQRWEIWYAELVHRDWIHSVNLFAWSTLLVMTLLHIIEDYSFDVSQNNNQVVSQELNGLDFTFPPTLEDNWRVECIHFVLYIVDENFIGELFINGGNEVKPFAIVG